jgi:hypothetical protein
MNDSTAASAAATSSAAPNNPELLPKLEERSENSLTASLATAGVVKALAASRMLESTDLGRLLLLTAKSVTSAYMSTCKFAVSTTSAKHSRTGVVFKKDIDDKTEHDSDELWKTLCYTHWRSKAVAESLMESTGLSARECMRKLAAGAKPSNDSATADEAWPSLQYAASDYSILVDIRDEATGNVLFCRAYSINPSFLSTGALSEGFHSNPVPLETFSKKKVPISSTRGNAQWVAGPSFDSFVPLQARHVKVQLLRKKGPHGRTSVKLLYSETIRDKMTEIGAGGDLGMVFDRTDLVLGHDVGRWSKLLNSNIAFVFTMYNTFVPDTLSMGTTTPTFLTGQICLSAFQLVAYWGSAIRGYEMLAGMIRDRDEEEERFLFGHFLENDLVWDNDE